MATKSYDLNFDGYWREPNIGGIPSESGIYGVYAATHNAAEQTVTLNRLIYIGESDDVRARIKGHEKWPMWRKMLKAGEIICFNMAPIAPRSDRERAEAAMIYEHKPVCNDQFVNEFPYDTTTVVTRGKNALMSSSFTVYTTAKRSYM